jgi:hypothetical protein
MKKILLLPMHYGEGNKWMTYKKSFNKKNSSEDGFVLVAAILAVLILMAVGIFALTSASQDINAVTRSVSEGNALSAAEAGVHILASNFDPNVLNDVINQPVLGATKSHYDILSQRYIGNAVAPGFNKASGNEWNFHIYDAAIIGRDDLLSGIVAVKVGVLDPIPKPGGTGGP